jgi:hypothetical protein
MLAARTGSLQETEVAVALGIAGELGRQLNVLRQRLVMQPATQNLTPKTQNLI